MGLESGTYISDLNIANPDGADLKSQGDDHLRLIKAVLKATFPNAARAFRLPNSLAAQTSGYSLAANIADNLVIPCNAASAGFTVTLPATPGTDGLKVLILKTDSTANAVTIAGNGNNINESSSYILNGQFQSVMLIWLASFGRWVAVGSHNAGLPTGAMMAYGAASPPFGWVRCNGLTIGNAASSATERANADTVSLFTFLWNNYADAQCPVISGRGASAAADFAASKRITLPDFRGRALAGLDDMGNSAAGRLNTISSTTNGAAGGAQSITLDSSQIPTHSHGFSATTSSENEHAHFIAADTANASGSRDISSTNYMHKQTRYSSGTEDAYSLDGTGTAPTVGLTSAVPAHAHTVSGTTGNAGSGGAHSNVQPTAMVTWLMKL